MLNRNSATIKSINPVFQYLMSWKSTITGLLKMADYYRFTAKKGNLK